MTSEIEKYRGIYSSPEEYPKYGHTNHGARALRVIVRWNPPSLIDVGCGWNEFCRSVRKSIPKIKARGVDFACPGADVTAPADRLPFRRKAFDVLTAFDMLEHILPAQVDAVLAEFARVSRRFIFSISHRESGTLFNGQNLHPTVRDEAWWLHRIFRAGGCRVKCRSGFIFGEWQTPLVIGPDARVVVVGNGPGVLKCDGRKIDAFDCVIRFNQYQLGQHVKNTGSKTSIWATNGVVALPGCDQRPKKVFHIRECNAIGYRARLNYLLPLWFRAKVDQYVNARARWMSGLEEDHNHPTKATCGLLVVAWLLQIAGVRKVTLAGFDHLEEKRSGLHHYWEKPRGDAFHDGAVEAVVFAELKACGRVEYLS